MGSDFSRAIVVNPELHAHTACDDKSNVVMCRVAELIEVARWWAKFCHPDCESCTAYGFPCTSHGPESVE